MVCCLLLVCLAITASAWNDCAFPQVDWFALDEGVGISYAYAIAAMNGNMYSGGYTKGNFAFVGVTDSADVNPVPSASLWGDTTSNVQNLYVAEVSSSGSMTKGWLFKGSAIQVGQIGHGKQTNSIDSHSGLHAMLDKQHIAVKGGFRQLLELPDGTLWSSAGRKNTKDQVPFVMSLDPSSTQGVGTGTNGWAKLMDDGHTGGATVYSVDGDTSGDMIVSYQGCGDFDASAMSTDAYGRPVQGAPTDCKNYIVKLAAATGAEVWKRELPTNTSGLSSCRTITDGSFFCGWTMSASLGNLDFGNGVTIASQDSRVGVIKYNSAGIAQWAKTTISASFGDLAVSKLGTLLAVVGSPGRGAAAVLARIDTSSGNEGNVLWSDAGGVGTHGFRGVEVTDDDNEVFAFGQLTGTETLTDTNGRSVTLRTRGSYEVFVVAYNAADGAGKYAMDGGGTGMEYFFAMASDPDTHDMYIGGTSRSEYITWGDVKRKNVMYNGDPGLNNAKTTTPVGSSKAFVVKLKSTLTMPTCLNSCNPAYPLQASDVKSGHCYIDRHCYAHGTFSPYSDNSCTKCDASIGPLAWSSPDLSNACFINGACVASGVHAQVRSGRSMVDDPCLKCDPSTTTGAYSAVAGCNLPSTFQAGVYTESGSMLMSLTAMEEENRTNHASIASMQARNLGLTSEKAEMQVVVDSLNSDKLSLNSDKLVLQTKLNDAGSFSNAAAITLIAVPSALFLLSFFTLVVVLCKEKNGNPLFAAAQKPVTGTPVTQYGVPPVGEAEVKNCA